MSEETGTPGRTEMQAYKTDPVNTESPTANHQDLEKQYNAELLITQQDILDDIMDIEAARVNVKTFGAVGDGVTDDTVAIQAGIDSAPGKLFFPEGIYVITSTLHVTAQGAIELIGAGVTAPTGAGESITAYAFKGSAILMTGSDTTIIDYDVDAFKGGNCGIKDMALSSSHDINDQHAILLKDHSHNFKLENVMFINITGYCWCWDVTIDAYSQNIRWENVSAYTVGGVIGYTADPSSGAKISTTLFQVDNFNLDHQLSSVSPQDYICDMRGMREVLLNNFLLEGNSGGGLQRGEYLIFDCDGSVIINNLHMEGLDAFWPDIWIRMTNSSYWFGDSNQTVTINGFWGGSEDGFVFETGSKGQIRINGFTCAQVPLATIDNWITFNGVYSGASLEINDFDGRRGYKPLVPDLLKGKVEITSNISTSASGLRTPAMNAPVTSTSAPLFKWRASEGIFDGIQTPYFTTIKEQTYTTDALATYDNTRVHHFNQTGSRGAYIGLQFALPTYLVGATITIIARCYFDGNLDREWKMFDEISAPNNWNGSTGIPVGYTQDGASEGRWATCMCTFVASVANLKILSTTSVSGTGTPDVYLAAYDVFLGTQFIEPFDLRTL